MIKWKERIEVVLESVKETATEFIEISAKDSEWGVEVVRLDERFRRIYAYRSTNPMVDFDWKIGDESEIAEALETMETLYKEYMND